MKIGVTLLIIDKMDFKTKNIVRDKEEYFMTKDKDIHKANFDKSLQL